MLSIFDSTIFENDFTHPTVSFPVLCTTAVSFAGVNQKLFSSCAQFVEVCPGESTRARIESPGDTAFPPRVPATDIVQRSHFIIAPAVPLHHVVGKVLPDAL